MSKEWFKPTRNSMQKARSGPLADPLDGEEWTGLLWILPLLTRFAGGTSPKPRHREARRTIPGLHSPQGPLLHR